MKRFHMVTNLETGSVTTEEVPDGVDLAEFMREQMDDCPLCREARERGEVPIDLTEEVLAMQRQHAHATAASRQVRRHDERKRRRRLQRDARRAQRRSH